MRGALRIQVLLLLALTGAVTGALVGWVAGVLWLVLGGPAPTTTAAVIVVLVVAGLEAIGRPRPPAVRTQVPQLWGRIFGSRTVAVLYGARLGIGPATILPTWLWWGAFVLSAACGPWVAAGAGALFAVTRTVVTHGAVAGVRSGPVMSRRIATVRRAERPIAVGVAVAVAVLALAGCGGGDDPAAAAPRRTTTTLAPATSSTAPATPEVLTLDDALLDDTLPGFHRDDAAVGAGPLDLEAAARAEVDVDAERAVLETRGFVRGASRAWTGPDDDVAYLAIYEFADAEGAAAYLVDGTEHLGARGATRFDVPPVVGARGFTTLDHDEDGTAFTAHAISFTRGPRWFLVLLGSHSGRRTTTEAIDLAQRQARA
ncbi:MAG: hypothetical protein JWO68_3395 [Actinomycetia bacterium]|nr:hypothetical protein [Actinomycetes bacterium]